MTENYLIYFWNPECEGGKKEQLDSDVILVSVGRRPYTQDLGLETCGINVNERGQIPVDDNFMVRFSCEILKEIIFSQKYRISVRFQSQKNTMTMPSLFLSEVCHCITTVIQWFIHIHIIYRGGPYKPTNSGGYKTARVCANEATYDMSHILITVCKL